MLNKLNEFRPCSKPMGVETDNNNVNRRFAGSELNPPTAVGDDETK